MPNQLTAIYAAIQDTVHSVDPAVTFARGMIALARIDTAPPRVVWVRGTGGVAPAEKTRNNPRALGTRVLRVMAHIWAADEDAADALANNLIVATYRNTYGSLAFEGETWPEVDEHYASRGAVVVLTFSFRVPITDELMPTVVITGYEPDLSSAVAGDGILQCGET